MIENYAGGCACGDIRYEMAGDPVAMLNCQCRQCQRDSGTGEFGRTLEPLLTLMQAWGQVYMDSNGITLRDPILSGQKSEGGPN